MSSAYFISSSGWTVGASLPLLCSGYPTLAQCPDRQPPPRNFPKLRAGLNRRKRPEHVELVAVWVGHDDPGDVGTLTDLDAACTESLQPRHLGRLIFWAQIEMEAVLHRLRLRHAQEQ